MIGALIRNILLWVYMYPVRVLVQKLPPSFTYWIGRLGGRLLATISAEKQELMKLELDLIFSKTPKQYDTGEVITSAFINYCVCELEGLLYPVLDRDLINRMITIEGQHNLDGALEKGKGVILMQAHFGAFQLTMPAIGYNGYTMNQISAPASVWKEMTKGSPIRQRIMDYKAGFEAALPVKHIQVSTSLRPAFKALKQNEILGITVDGGGGKRLVSLSFLGRTAQFQQGGIEIALRTGAVLLPAFIVRETDFRHRLILHKPLKVDEDADKDTRIRLILEEYIRLLESYIYQYPAQYTYSLYLKRSRARLDSYPFFTDYFEETS